MSRFPLIPSEGRSYKEIISSSARKSDIVFGSLFKKNYAELWNDHNPPHSDYISVTYGASAASISITAKQSCKIQFYAANGYHGHGSFPIYEEKTVESGETIYSGTLTFFYFTIFVL